MGGMGFALQAGQPLSMEGVNSFPHALVTAVELGRHLLGSLALIAGQENLTAPEGEGIGGAQPLLKGH
jgi:hypothetical protein